MKQAWPAEPILLTSTLLMGDPVGDAGRGGWITYNLLAFFLSSNVFNVIQFFNSKTAGSPSWPSAFDVVNESDHEDQFSSTFIFC